MGEKHGLRATPGVAELVAAAPGLAPALAGQPGVAGTRLPLCPAVPAPHILPHACSLPRQAGLASSESVATLAAATTGLVSGLGLEVLTQEGPDFYGELCSLLAKA